MKSFFKIFPAIACSVLLFGCDAYTSWALDDNDNISADGRVCKRLKRQMIFNARNPNQDAKYIARSQTDRLRQLYAEYDCDAILAGKQRKIDPTTQASKEPQASKKTVATKTVPTTTKS